MVHQNACDTTIIRSDKARPFIGCEHGVEGTVCKRISGRYEPDRRTWLKIKCLNREEFVVVGWSDPEGSRHRIGSLLLGYYTLNGELIYAGRAGTGLPGAELERLWQRLPLVVEKMPLAVPPPRRNRFGSPVVLSRVHWVHPEMVVEITYGDWTPDGCSGTSSTRASAKIGWAPKCAAIHLADRKPVAQHSLGDDAAASVKCGKLALPLSERRRVCSSIIWSIFCPTQHNSVRGKLLVPFPKVCV
jgi:hypothetical protein